jgi:hypothetical protein
MEWMVGECRREEEAQTHAADACFDVPRSLQVIVFGRMMMMMNTMANTTL